MPCLDSAVSTIPGVTAAIAAQLERLGVTTVRDLIRHYPYRYDDLRSITPVAEFTFDRTGDAKGAPELNIAGTIIHVSHVRLRGRVRAKTTALVDDGTGKITAVWFGRPYLGTQLEAGMRLFAHGRVGGTPQRPTILVSRHRTMGPDEHHAAELVPVYPQTAGLRSQTIARLVRKALSLVSARGENSRFGDPLPRAVTDARKLPPVDWALETIHSPPSPQMAERARYRLVFEEFFLLAAAAAARRASRQAEDAPDFSVVADGAQHAVAEFDRLLPFRLTAAQSRAIGEIVADMVGKSPMNRLLQGDVACGKTAVAAAAILLAVRAGYQVAFMAPTEILAVQQFDKLSAMLVSAGVRTALLVGALKGSSRDDVLYQMKSSEIDVIVGTHALITGDVEFARLGLVVIDEQHRFGVMQRAALRAKAKRFTPHTLVMTATPIPRTLAQSLYADLDISIIDELPPGRRPVKTFVRKERDKTNIFGFVRKEVERGRQAYVVCPAIDDSDRALHSAVKQAERLKREDFAGLRVALLHGRMTAKQKDEVMRLFGSGFISILIATSVVEVGLDVANATVMVVLDAQAFGLAQLHQLRGRVGRGDTKAYCVLVAPEDASALSRLELLESTSDGFALAEADLKERGAGDLAGTRQHGGAEMRIAHLIRDFAVYGVAKQDADAVLSADPALKGPEHAGLAAALAPAESTALRVTS
ncbi:MAG: ATP-dependent DNA helicase RecG [Candidatus Eremiobacteraeota bacterium]|nr:ATP-dependent DNA helicase RecG [Candidatus Eremiobacteraeota bacterium]MBC5826972.1 ATP-dependent DNA helicase RecG [Candidatus Eremiobacteraeota bacterium]